VLIALARGDTPIRRGILAFSLLTLAIYGTIATGRSLYLLLGRPPAVLGATPRYHYAAGAALTVLICTVLAWLGTRWALPVRWRTTLLGAWLVGTVVIYARSGYRIEHFDESRAQTEAFLAMVRSKVAGVPPGATVTIENRYFRPIGPLISPALFPGSAAAFMIFSPTNEIDGHPVRFTTRDQRCLAVARTGGRLSALLVEPDTPPP
jgi:hypothetical protein